jgi:hypothetical protein
MTWRREGEEEEREREEMLGFHWVWVFLLNLNQMGGFYLFLIGYAMSNPTCK